jgi:CDP-diacylglycerol--serine O-phosphatidyltransferase
MNIKKHIPNAITCCNLLCGCLALVQAFEGNLVHAAYLVGMGAIFDFFDGFAARILKVSSPIGKDLDSLTDMVTFGVVPGIVMYKLIFSSLLISVTDGAAAEGWTIYPPLVSSTQDTFEKTHSAPEFLIYIAFIITIFSAIRLAKFNNDTRQTDSFIGVPTPAVALFICALPLILNHNNHYDFILNPYLLTITSVILSFLLISELPLFALKFKHFKWAGNELRFVFLGLCLVLLITLQFIGIPLIIIMYILLSIFNNVINKKKAVS